MVQKRNNIDFEIILLLVKGNNHVRGIAKNLEEPHSTILRRLNELVKENVIDYKFEGKNKVFFIKKNLQAKSYVFNAERYKQIKILKKYPELSVIAEDILKQCHENLIIIFGSYAKFIAKLDSDIDVYVETRDKKVKYELESIHSKINVKIGSFNLDSPLMKEIIKNHVILKGVEEFYEKIKFFD
jgi:predicted nucleotidyltransferase